MDKLDIIFDMQKKLDGEIAVKRGLEYTKEEWIQKRMLAMLSEMAETLDEVNFKWWKNKKDVNVAALKEELVDILHFYIGMCLDAGLDAVQLFDTYIKKNEENFKRQYGQSDKSGYNLADLHGDKK